MDSGGKFPKKPGSTERSNFPPKKMWKKSIQGGPLPVISWKYSFRRFSFDIRWCCPLVFYCIFTDETSTMASCRNKNVAFLWRTLKTTTRERSIKRKNFMKHLSSRRSNIEDSTSFVYSTGNIYIPNHIVICLKDFAIYLTVKGVILPSPPIIFLLFERGWTIYAKIISQCNWVLK